MFGITASFDVFDGRLTGHVFSDTGSGCVFDCHFCSERRSITGRLAQPDTAAHRLVLQQRLVTSGSAGVVRLAGAGLPVASPA
jgi:hypothetical protein